MRSQESLAHTWMTESRQGENSIQAQAGVYLACLKNSHKEDGWSVALITSPQNDLVQTRKHFIITLLSIARKMY